MKPLGPPAADEEGKPVDEEKLRKLLEKRRAKAEKLAEKFPSRFEYRPDDGIVIGHNPMAPDYDATREPDDADA